MEFVLPMLNTGAILPQLIVLGAALVVLLLDVFWSNKKGIGVVALAGVVAAGVVALATLPAAGASFQDMAVADRVAKLLVVIVAAAAALAILMSLDYTERMGIPGGEYYGLLLLAASGMMFLGAATHLMTIFLSVEILSISLYALAGLNRKEPRSGESALKYFLLGGFASAFLLYGMALVYGATGTTSLAGIRTELATTARGLAANPMYLVGMGLMLVGFGFKIAAVPFHMWTPDVYQGAPTSVAAFMAAGAKAAGFIALWRVLTSSFPRVEWMWPVAILAVLTMTWGNLAALRQTNVKRMLAYSSIAHAGYLLVGVCAGDSSAILFYLAAYTLMTVGAFAVLVGLERADADAGGVTLDGLRGQFQRHPWLAAAMTIFMLSLAGIPPLAGFLGKLYVFSAAVKANLAWLAVFGVINSVISAYYYLRVVGRMAQDEPAEESAGKRSIGLGIGVALAAIGVVLLGIWPAPLLGLL